MRCLFLLLFLFLVFSCKERERLQERQQPELNEITLPTEEQLFINFLDSLNRAGAGDHQKVNAIRKYLAAFVDYGYSQDSLFKSYHKIPWDEFSGFRSIKLFKEDRLAAQCGLTSYVLSKLFTYAGYQNFIYSCGYANTEISHEFNLVKVNNQVVVQDAFMNMTITNADGSPKDFIQLLAEIKNNDTSNIMIAGETISSDVWVDSLTKEFLASFCSVNSAQLEQLHHICIEGNRVRMSINRSYGLSAQRMMDLGKDKLKQEGLNESFLSFYLKPIHVKDGKTGASNDSLFNVINTATGNGSPD